MARHVRYIINISIVCWHLRIRSFFHYLLDLFGRTIDTRFNAFLNVLDSIPGHLQNTALTSFCRDGGKLRARGSVDWHGVLLQSTTRSKSFLTTVVSGLLLGVVAMDIWTAFDGGVLINSSIITLHPVGGEWFAVCWLFVSVTSNGSNVYFRTRKTSHASY